MLYSHAPLMYSYSAQNNSWSLANFRAKCLNDLAKELIVCQSIRSWSGTMSEHLVLVITCTCMCSALMVYLVKYDTQRAIKIKD